MKTQAFVLSAVSAVVLDLGYWMDYKISEAHYKNSSDKKQSVHELLIVKDCQQLLKASRYAEKFAAPAPVQK